jgi:hypothetical protein
VREQRSLLVVRSAPPTPVTGGERIGVDMEALWPPDIARGHPVRDEPHADVVSDAPRVKDRDDRFPQRVCAVGLDVHENPIPQSKGIPLERDHAKHRTAVEDGAGVLAGW